MKKASVIIVLIMLFNLNNIVFGSDIDITIEQITKTEEYNINKKDVMWSGKEWITSEYPPEISYDGINFETVLNSDSVKDILKNTSVGYLWTGKDYLVYNIMHDYRKYTSDKYLYRLSSDMNTVLNTYKIPDWINHIAIIDDICYIAVENACPVYVSGTERIVGERRNNFMLYYSRDYETWSKINIDFDISNLGYRPSMHLLKNYLIIADYDNKELGQYTQQCKNVWRKSNDIPEQKIVYELLKPMKIGKCGEYLYTQVFDKKNSETSISFSLDGIYWHNIKLQRDIYVDCIYEKQNNIIIKAVINNEEVYYHCSKSQLDFAIKNLSDNDEIYVQFNDKILGFEQPPVIEAGRTLVPMRFLFEQMGADVSWNSETQTATAEINDTAVTFAIDNIEAKVNTEPATMEVPARLINGKTMVPLRFLSEELGYIVTWDEEARTAVIE